MQELQEHYTFYVDNIKSKLLKHIVLLFLRSLQFSIQHYERIQYFDCLVGI